MGRCSAAARIPVTGGDGITVGVGHVSKTLQEYVRDIVSGSFRIDESIRGGRVYLALAGEVKLDVRRQIRDRLTQHLRSESVRGIVVDLTSATFIDANGLGILLACRRRALDARKTFRVSATSDLVAGILEPMGVMGLLAGATTLAPFSAN
jgi:anti-anti-sigma factor